VPNSCTSRKSFDLNSKQTRTSRKPKKIQKIKKIKDYYKESNIISDFKQYHFLNKCDNSLKSNLTNTGLIQQIDEQMINNRNTNLPCSSKELIIDYQTQTKQIQMNKSLIHTNDPIFTSKQNILNEKLLKPRKIMNKLTIDNANIKIKFNKINSTHNLKPTQITSNQKTKINKYLALANKKIKKLI
jgi:hypothetical protein